jgi:hypothetical protein
MYRLISTRPRTHYSYHLHEQLFGLAVRLVRFMPKIPAGGLPLLTISRLIMRRCAGFSETSTCCLA